MTHEQTEKQKFERALRASIDNYATAHLRISNAHQVQADEELSHRIATINALFDERDRLLRTVRDMDAQVERALKRADFAERELAHRCEV